MGRIECRAMAWTEQDRIGGIPFDRAAGVRADRVERDERAVLELDDDPGIPGPQRRRRAERDPERRGPGLTGRDAERRIR